MIMNEHSRILWNTESAMQDNVTNHIVHIVIRIFPYCYTKLRDSAELVLRQPKLHVFGITMLKGNASWNDPQSLRSTNFVQTMTNSTRK